MTATGMEPCDAIIFGDLGSGISTSARRRNRMCRSIAKIVAFAQQSEPAVVIIPQYIVVEAWTGHSAPPGLDEANINGNGAGGDDDVQADHNVPVCLSACSEAEVLPGNNTDGTGVDDIAPPIKVPPTLPRLFEPPQCDWTSSLTILQQAGQEVLEDIIFLAQARAPEALHLGCDMLAQRAELSTTIDQILDVMVRLEDATDVHTSCDFKPLLAFANTMLKNYTSWLDGLDSLICATGSATSEASRTLM